MNKKIGLLTLIILLIISSCKNQQPEGTIHPNDRVSNKWKLELEETLSLLGHRNWIVIAGKAFT